MRERFWIDGEARNSSPHAAGAPADFTVIEDLLTKIDTGALDEDLGVQRLKDLM
jgi:hypothetical protein